MKTEAPAAPARGAAPCPAALLNDLRAPPPVNVSNTLCDHAVVILIMPSLLSSLKFPQFCVNLMGEWKMRGTKEEEGVLCSGRREEHKCHQTSYLSGPDYSQPHPDRLDLSETRTELIILTSVHRTLAFKIGWTGFTYEEWHHLPQSGNIQYKEPLPSLPLMELMIYSRKWMSLQPGYLYYVAELPFISLEVYILFVRDTCTKH